MLRLSPRAHFLLRSLGGLRSQHWREAAVENWELAPAETRINPRPICIDGQLEKARGLNHEWRVEVIPTLFSPTLTHKATTAHLLRNVDLVGTSLYSGQMRHILSDHAPPILDREPVERIASGVLATGYSGNKWFWHFITDTSSMCLMAADVAAARNSEVVAAPMPTDQVGQRQQYLDLFEIDMRHVSRARFDELTIIDPLGLNSYHRKQMAELRRRIRERFSPLQGHQRVFLRRGSHGEIRDAENQLEIETILTDYGFRILEPESMTLDNLIASILDAHIVVGIEGSQFAHALLAAADGATMLTLQPPHRFSTTIKTYSDELGMRWGFLIGHTRAAKHYAIDSNELRRTLDLALSDAGRTVSSTSPNIVRQDNKDLPNTT